MNYFQTSDGLRLAYSDKGTGRPLLCLPGLTRNSSDFEDLEAALAGRYRIIALTLRGRGESDRDPNYLNYNVMVEARDVIELLDHLRLPKVVIVGTSRGGLIAMALAVIAKERLAGVLLNDIGPEIAPEGLERIMTYLGIPPKAADHAQGAAAIKATMQRDFPGLPDGKWLTFAKRWFNQGPDGLELNYDPRLRMAVQEATAQPAPDMWPLFDALEGVPVAVLQGANSDLLRSDTVARMKEHRPDLIVAVVPDRGHVPMLDEPDSLAALAALMERAEG